jgi:alkylhydroperoxidase family enzyme
MTPRWSSCGWDTCAAVSTSCSSTAGSPSGVDAGTQEKVFAWPQARDGLTAREQALLAGVDELIATRAISDAGWRLLAGYLDRRQLIEFVTLVGQYDALAMTLSTLGVPLDYPD